MMIRQDYKASSENRAALYCQHLEYDGEKYEYISFILDDEKMVDYYFLEDDSFRDTYNIYFDDLYLGKNYNVKVVAKLKDDYLFEVASLWCYCIESNWVEDIDNLVSSIELSNIAPPTDIIMPCIEVVG